MGAPKENPSMVNCTLETVALPWGTHVAARLTLLPETFPAEGDVIVTAGGPVDPPCPAYAPRSQGVDPVGRGTGEPPNHGVPLASKQSAAKLAQPGPLAPLTVKLAPCPATAGSGDEGLYFAAALKP